jgi:hypothetical protein
MSSDILKRFSLYKATMPIDHREPAVSAGRWSRDWDGLGICRADHERKIHRTETYIGTEWMSLHGDLSAYTRFYLGSSIGTPI